MVRLGRFFFKYRNVIFPLFFVLLVFGTRPLEGNEQFDSLRYALGIGVTLAGQVVRAMTIGLAYIIRGGKNREAYAENLVSTGVFAHSRNPLYLGNIMIVAGLGIVAHSSLFYVVGIPAFIFMYMAITRSEEDYLGKKFGDEYVDYRKSVNRFIPNFTGFGKTLRGMKFNWARLVIKDYGTVYVWVMVCIVLILKGYYARHGEMAAPEVVGTFYILMVITTVLYGIARYLKKSRRLTE